jgi:Xaa-Pro aminopeptidase
MNINDLIGKLSLDAVIITSKEFRRYFSGFTGSDGVLLVTPGKQHLFVDGRYTFQAREQAGKAEVTECNPYTFSFLTDFSLQRIGFEDRSISYAEFKRLSAAAPNAEFVGVSAALNELRMVKTPEELALMQQAADIADRAFSHILSFLKPGISEAEVALELEFFMRKEGAEGLSFDTIVAAGERSALPHASPTDRKIEKGDLVLMDYGCVYQGYCSDMTRTVAMGAASSEQKAIYQTVLEAQLACLDALRPGVSCAQADGIARRIIEEAGFPFLHSTGHGVGLEIHEEPRLSPKSAQQLAPGMVTTVEPGIYQEGLCGIRIEDMVYITRDGYCNFTHSPKDLLVL